jgi:polyferredoxin
MLEKDINKNRNSEVLLNHLYANSIYALLISTIILFILMAFVINGNFEPTPFVVFISTIVYFIVTHFIITLLMIFRRLFILLFSF